MHHVFVDFENVPRIDLSSIGTRSVCFTLLLGARQTKLDVALVEKLVKHAASVQLIRLDSSGRNALDFALAYYVGRATMSDPTGHFHIVSKDTGYDPLIKHLQRHNIHARRHTDCSTLPFVSVSKSAPVPKSASVPVPAPVPKPAVALPEELFSRALEHLRRQITDRPKRRRTLISHLRAHLGKTTTEADVLALIAQLQTAGHIGLSDGGTVSYTV